jgi:hypothetical protein
VDHSKAVRELGWQPRPVEESIREAALFWVGLREARRKARAAAPASEGAEAVEGAAAEAAVAPEGTAAD